MRAMSVIDIGFTSLQIISPSMAAVGCSPAQGIVPVPGNYASKRHGGSDEVLRFAIARDDSVLEFAPFDESDFMQWKDAISSVTI
jgi:hypothetical protein